MRAWQSILVFLPRAMDRGAWWAKVPSVTKSQTQVNRLSTHAQIKIPINADISNFARELQFNSQ